MKYFIITLFLLGCPDINDEKDSGVWQCEGICENIVDCDFFVEIASLEVDGGPEDFKDFCLEVCENGEAVEDYECLDSIKNCEIKEGCF